MDHLLPAPLFHPEPPAHSRKRPALLLSPPGTPSTEKKNFSKTLQTGNTFLQRDQTLGAFPEDPHTHSHWDWEGAPAPRKLPARPAGSRPPAARPPRPAPGVPAPQPHSPRQGHPSGSRGLRDRKRAPDESPCNGPCHAPQGAEREIKPKSDQRNQITVFQTQSREAASNGSRANGPQAGSGSALLTSSATAAFICLPAQLSPVKLLLS